MIFRNQAHCEPLTNKQINKEALRAPIIKGVMRLEDG